MLSDIFLALQEKNSANLRFLGNFLEMPRSDLPLPFDEEQFCSRKELTLSGLIAATVDHLLSSANLSDPEKPGANQGFLNAT
ncbi:MAG: hypothetical protein M3Y65_08110 [Pseudomonadota bacterium]|nr:hypothetical protein [Pseudomonadota bacterium]